MVDLYIKIFIVQVSMTINPASLTGMKKNYFSTFDGS